MAKLLLVDDDLTLGPLIKEYLETHDFTCVLCHNAFDGLKSFKKEDYDLCILDIVMPLMNGLELANEFKYFKANVPFLFLSSKGSIEDRIKGLEHGADDYILKPFSMKELLLRINTILKRSKDQESIANANKEYNIGQYVFHLTSRELLYHTLIIHLSDIEAQLLSMFCESPDGIIYRDRALNQIWRDEYNFKSRSLNVYISKLRKYLIHDEMIKIKNIHGKGYQMIIKSN